MKDSRMLAILDLIPVVIFFAVYRFYDIYMATTALIVSMVILVAIHWLVHRKVSNMMLTSAGLAIGLGAITLWLRNPLFVQWKPTIVYWLFGLVLLGAEMFTGKTIFERTMGEAAPIPAPAWRRFNLFWVVIFVGMGVLNLYFAYNFSEAAWVSFKLWAAIGLSLLLFAVTGIFLYRNMPAENADEGEQ